MKSVSADQLILSTLMKMRAVSNSMLHLRTTPVLWTKTALMFSLLLSTSTASSPYGKLLTGLFFLSHLAVASSGSSVFVVPSTELWTGSTIEVGCYTDQDKQIIWARQPLGGGEEELVAHQDTLLLLDQDARITVFVQQLANRQVSKVTISEALPADSGKYSCISMGGASAEEERTEVMVAVFDEINDEVDLTQSQNMNNGSDINSSETIVMEGTRGPRLDATTSLRSNAVRNLGGFSVEHLTNLFLAILVHTNC